MKLTPDQLEKIRHADAANLIKKVKAGRTLTAAERKLLESLTDEPPPSDDDLITTSKLAQLFGINRKTVAEWRKENRPGVPAKVKGKEPLAEWRAWFAANPSAGHYDGKPRKDRESLLCEKLEVEIAIKKIELGIQAREYLPAGQVQEDITRICSAARAELINLSNDLPPRLAGLGEAQMQKVLRTSIHEILTRLADDANELYEQPETT